MNIQKKRGDPGPAAAAFANGPLQGVKVVDLTGVVMGPFGTHILADLGADVVKIETSDGDVLRHYQPQRSRGMSGQVMHLHRNKRSAVLNLKTEPGKRALRALIAQSDVLVHNMRPKTIAKLGFDYAAVREMNPDIVYCGAFGFGSAGPYANKAAYDDLIQACSGFADLSSRVSGHPSYAPTVICDKLAGQAIAYAVSAALYQRAMGGGGQEVEVPMFEVSIEFMLIEHIAGASFLPPMSEVGFKRVLSKFRKPFASKDGHVCILPYSDRNWHDFFAFIGLGGLSSDVRFLTHDSRSQNVSELYALIETEAARRSTQQWLEFCDEVNIPCMPVLSLDTIEQDPHVDAVGLFARAEHPTEGSYRAMRSPVRFGASEFKIRRHAPRIGEHTEEVLREIDLSEDEIAELLETSAPDPALVPVSEPT